jgi:hypothetical protein
MKRKPMYIPSITNLPKHQIPSNPFPRPQRPTSNNLARMSGVLGKRAVLLGVGAVGVGLIAAGKMAPSKKQAVVWGMSGELDKVNSKVDATREQAFGYVSLSIEELDRAHELAFGYVASSQRNMKLTDAVNRLMGRPWRIMWLGRA